MTTSPSKAEPIEAVPALPARHRQPRRGWRICWSTTVLIGIVAGAAGNDLPPGSSGPLMEAAQAWARALRAPASTGASLFAPPDARTAATPCPGGWRFDLPFSDLQAVRARCAEPRLQVFLRANVPLRAGDERAATRPAPDPATGQPQAPEPRQAPPPAPPRDAGTAAPAPRPAETRPRQVLTLRQDLRRGALLDAPSVARATVDLPTQRGLGDPIEDPATLEHMELVRDKLAGQVLYTNDIQPTLLVRKGQLIVVTMQNVPGLTITARLEALQDGRIGETVRLRNRDSGRIVSAEVVGPNAARLP